MIHTNEELNTKLDAILALLTNQTAKPLTLSEAAAYLNVGKSHLYRLTSEGTLPFYKPAGKKIYFVKRDLDQYILRNRHKGKAEIETEADSYMLTRP